MAAVETHLRNAIKNLDEQYKIAVDHRPASIAYRETIRGFVDKHSRYKKQTGGHGQFAEVHMKISPNERGAGLEFTESIVGGTVPKRFIPGVEKGVREFMKRGPLGFPVVDVCVNLYDGKFHAVDSSEQSFKTAAKQAMREGTREANPVLLEPVHRVSVCVAQRVHVGRPEDDHLAPRSVRGVRGPSWLDGLGHDRREHARGPTCRA